jgi:hypothetical protein
MTINTVCELQEYSAGNTYSVQRKNYNSSDCLLDLDEMLGSWEVHLAGRQLSKHTKRIYHAASGHTSTFATSRSCRAS